ncbi:hypothetical protein JVU11DRAFT_8500 [Chiua virens]|nr:hypothetical protein JVU11DRAFT_8500 [Chiua virens]
MNCNIDIWNKDSIGSRPPMSLKLWNTIQNDTRDILNESDEILHPRSQLIYALGHQQHVDGYPTRWAITQQVLWLTKKHLSSLNPYEIKYELGPSGSFPHTRILHWHAGVRLISSIVEDVMQGSENRYVHSYLTRISRWRQQIQWRTMHSKAPPGIYCFSSVGSLPTISFCTLSWNAGGM